MSLVVILLGKWMSSARQLVQNHPQRPDVRLHTRLPRHKLLRSHVANGSPARRERRWHRRFIGRHRLCRIDTRVVRRQPPRETEVQYLHQATIGQHHVLRLQVTVKDAQRVRRLQPIRDLNADRQYKLQVRGTALNQRVQRLPGHKLHRDVGFLAALSHLVDCAHIGMLDRRRQPRLAQHSRPHLLRRQQPGVQHLQHHRPLQQGVVGGINHAASSGSQPPQNLVMCNRPAFHRSS